MPFQELTIYLCLNRVPSARHRGLVSLDQNRFKTNLMVLAVKYVKVVSDLAMDDSERLKRFNRRMADNIQRMEDEKDGKIARLEGQIRRMEEAMPEIGDRGGPKYFTGAMSAIRSSHAPTSSRFTWTACLPPKS